MKGTGQVQVQASRGVVGTLALLAYWLLKLALKIAFRYVVGLPLDGNRTTDATWASDGTQLVDKKANFFGRREPSKWSLMAGWKRAAWRLGIPAGLLVTAAAWSAHPALVRAAATIAAGIVLGYNGFRCFEWVRMRHHRTHYLEPLAEVLGERLGVDAKLQPAEWIDLPLDFRAEHAVITIDLPIRFLAGEDPTDAAGAWGRRTLGGERAVVNSIVSEKLGLSMSEMTAQFHMIGAEPYAEYRHLAKVPDLVTVDMAREAIQAAAPSKPVLGLGRGSKVVAIDVDVETPHILVSCGAGAGKSYLARCLIAQFLRNGAVVVILDVKRVSQRWVKGHPHVVYARDIADIHDALLALDEEVDRRTRLIDLADEGDAMPYVGPRLLVVCEEMNMMTELLKNYWGDVRSKDDPKTSPAVAAVQKLSLMGREPLIHLLAIGQLMTAQASGGNASRENFGARIMGRYTSNAWRMLAPEILMPRASRRRGRVQVTMGGEVDETQAVRWEVEEARDWAWSCFKEGRQVTASQRPMRALFRGESAVTVSNPSQQESFEPRELADSAGRPLALLQGGAAASTETRSSTRTDVPASQQIVVGEVIEEELVTLRQAVRRQIVTVSPDEKRALMILRKARQRDVEFPDPAGKRGRDFLYRPHELKRWQRNRPNSPEGASA